MRSWARIVQALGDAAPRLKVRPAASEVQIVAAEGVLGFRLPPDYRAFLQICDGQEDGLSICDAGIYFAPLEHVVAQWQFERGFDVDLGTTETDCDDRVRGLVYHPRRLPIAGSPDLGGGGNWILDLAPGPKGVSGQLLALVSECEFEVRAASLAAYFDAIADQLERGELAPTTNPWGYEVLTSRT